MTQIIPQTSEEIASPAICQAPPSRLPAMQMRERYLWKLLAFVVLNGILLNSVFYLMNVYLVRHDLGEKSHGTFGPLKAFSTLAPGQDSFGAMMPAVHLLEENSAASPYDVFFFRNHQQFHYRMFQYPLSSLLPYYLLQRAGVSDKGLFRITTAVFWLSVWGVIVVALLIALRSFSKQRQGSVRSKRATLLIAVNIGVAGFLFYPLTKSFSLGQIQALLAFGFAIAFYCWMSGREKSAGAIIGLMALVKPQYALFLVWALLRKKIGAFTAGILCVISGILAACLLFGFHSNFEYLKVIHVLGQHGAGFYPNQSVNGTLNRLLFNGNNLVWDEAEIVPYNSIVYFGTLLTSLALIVFALFFPWGARRKGGVADMACCVLVSTMASPVAWEHHYAILLPIFAWLWFDECDGGAGHKWEFPLALAFVLTSNFILPATAFAKIPGLNILQSYLYFGAAIVLVLLAKSRSERFMELPRCA